MATEDFWENLARQNLSESEYLEKALGPKFLPMEIVLPMTLIYVTIFITGVFGNAATCMVIVKNTVMQNATNYYLFSLAISDLMLLIIGLPNELSVFWQQYPYPLGAGLCKTRAYVSEMSSYVSVITIVAFSVERYLAICHPLSANAMSGSKRVVKIIVGIWLVCAIPALPYAFYSDIYFLEYPPGSGNVSLDSAICSTLMSNVPFYELSCIIFFLIPMVIIMVLYVRMGLKIRSSIKLLSTGPNEFENSAHYDCKKVRSRRSVIRMLSAVVVMFFICWAPFHAQRLLYVYGQASDYYPDLSEWLYLTSGCLYYVSTTVNPILYNLLSTRYRVAFKRTLLCTKLPPETRSFNGKYNRRYSDNGPNSLHQSLRENGTCKKLITSPNFNEQKRLKSMSTFCNNRTVEQKLSTGTAATKLTIEGTEANDFS